MTAKEIVKFWNEGGDIDLPMMEERVQKVILDAERRGMLKAAEIAKEPLPFSLTQHINASYLQTIGKLISASIRSAADGGNW